MVTLIRSMSHGEAAHERGTHNMFTGYRPSPALDYPSIGSVISHELGSRNDFPPYVCVPSVPNEYANSGYLSSAFGPFALGADPAKGDFQVRDLNLPKGVDDARFARRLIEGGVRFVSLTAGRDHWPRVLSTMLAGGGMKQGYVHGASDALGGDGDTDGVSVADLATTLYHQIGIRAQRQCRRRSGQTQRRILPLTSPPSSELLTQPTDCG
jgi:hypothetical protein